MRPARNLLMAIGRQEAEERGANGRKRDREKRKKEEEIIVRRQLNLVGPVGRQTSTGRAIVQIEKEGDQNLIRMRKLAFVGRHLTEPSWSP